MEAVVSYFDSGGVLYVLFVSHTVCIRITVVMSSNTNARVRRVASHSLSFSASYVCIIRMYSPVRNNWGVPPYGLGKKLTPSGQKKGEKTIKKRRRDKIKMGRIVFWQY